MRAWYGGITVCWWWYASLSLLICGERSASQFIQDGMVPYYHTTIPYREAAFHTLSCLCLKSQKQPWRPTIIIWYVCTVAPQIIFVFLNQVCLLPFTTPHDLEPKSFFSAKERSHTEPNINQSPAPSISSVGDRQPNLQRTFFRLWWRGLVVLFKIDHPTKTAIVVCHCL